MASHGTPLDPRLPSRPLHQRQQSKSSLFKALVSPVKKSKQQDDHEIRGRTQALDERGNNARSPPRARSTHARSRVSQDERKDTLSSTLAGSKSRTSIDKENSRPSIENARPNLRQTTSMLAPQTPRLHSSPRKISDGSAESPAKKTLSIMKRGARVMAAVAAIQSKTTPAVLVQQPEAIDPELVERKFEAMLSSRNIAQAQRDEMRKLSMRIKIDLVKQHQGDLESTVSSRSSNEHDVAQHDRTVSTKRERSRSRARSRTFGFSRESRQGDDDASPTKRKRGRSRSRPAPIQTSMDATADLATPTTPRSRSARGSRIENPADYIDYLWKEQDPVKVEVGRLHKLRILLRNETVAWVDSFIALDGLSQIIGLLHRVMAIEWREDHEDQLLHETLLCLKGLCTTDSALEELQKFADDLFPALLAMLFGHEKKGPAEYATRAIIVNVLFAYLSAKVSCQSSILEARARTVLRYLSKPKADTDSVPLDFVVDMQLSRPYKLWCKEVTNVTSEVFWIFLHHINVVPSPKNREIDTTASYTSRHFPGVRAPVPAAPYIGGVEWDATTYITSHLELLNGLIASLPTREARNDLRRELRNSGFEKTMGSTLRTCKEKFYGGVHDVLRAWVAAATEDEWPVLYVCEGPSLEEQAKSTRSSPKKSPNKEPAPKLDEIKIEMPKLDLDMGILTNNDNDTGWLDAA